MNRETKFSRLLLFFHLSLKRNPFSEEQMMVEHYVPPLELSTLNGELLGTSRFNNRRIIAQS
jgi:hypothetical protein